MFVIKKVVALFLIPPGLFVSVLFITGMVLLVRKRLKPALFCLILGGLMWGLSTSPVSDAVIGKLDSGFSIPENPKGDVIVLLCGGSLPEVPDLSGTGAPSGMTMARLITAARLQKRLGLPIIVSGGSVLSRLPSEASIVGRFLRDLGVTPDMVILEEKSRDTFENAVYTAVILKASGYQRPILVTSALHLRRAAWCFKKAGHDVLPFPADIRTYDGKSYTWASFLPISYRTVAAALHEYLGIVYYRLVYFR